MASQQLNIPPHLKCVATLPREMFFFKNRNDLDLSEANFHARLSHSKQLLKNIHPVMLASFCSLTKTIFTVITLKTPQNDRLHAHPSTRKKDVATKRLRTL